MVDPRSAFSLHKEGSCCPAGEMWPSHTSPSLLLCGLKRTVGCVARTRCKHEAPPPRPANVLRHSSVSEVAKSLRCSPSGIGWGRGGLRPSPAQGTLHFYSSFGLFRVPGCLHSQAPRHQTILASVFPACRLSFSWENHGRAARSLMFAAPLCTPQVVDLGVN